MRRLILVLTTIVLMGVGTSMPVSSTRASSQFAMATSKSKTVSTANKRLDTYMKALVAQNRFSGVVLVAQKGKILLSKGYGLADQQNKVTNSPTMKYPAPGITFSMSLVTTLKLEEQGKIHDADLVCSFLSSCPDSWKPMTVGMVLNGTSSLPDSNWESTGHTVDDTLAACQAQPLTGTPVTQLDYRNCTPLVLGLIAEKVTGKPWATFMRDTVFTPAGMKNSGQMTDSLIPPARAEDYSGGNPDPSTRYNTYFAVYSTLRDIYAYDQALFAGKLISKASLARMSVPRDSVRPSDLNIANGHWAYFWKTGTVFKHGVIYTISNVHSFTAINMRFPKDGLTIVVLSNEDLNDVEGVGVHAAAIVFGAKVPAAPAGPTGPPPVTVDPTKAIQATINTDGGCTTEPLCYVNLPIATPDGIWTPFGGTGKAVHINTTTNTATTITVVQQAYDASGGSDTQSIVSWNGQIWTTDQKDSAIARIDPATDRVVETIHVDTHVALLAVSGDTLWISAADAAGFSLVRFDLVTKKVVATIPNLGQVFALLPTPDALWAALWDTSEFVRIDPATNQVVARFKAGTNPQALALGDGSLWVANGFGHYLTRMDPATGKIESTIPLDQHGDAKDSFPWCACEAVTIDANGVWAIAHDTRKLVHIDPQTNRVTSSLTLPNAPDGTPLQPWDVLSAEGSLWVTAAPHVVLRIDPKTLETP
jgi:CubicO group peptidase (beta-lactamase class C family)/streptogramin lyase